MKSNGVTIQMKPFYLYFHIHSFSLNHSNFGFVGEIVWCHLPNETSSAILHRMNHFVSQHKTKLNLFKIISFEPQSCVVNLHRE